MDFFLNSQILSVDAVSDSADLIETMLQAANRGYWVTMVATAEQALNRLAYGSFDLCIIEYALPDATGPQLCSRMRENGFNKPIMFFTAMSRPVDRANAIASGADDFLVNPDDLDIFPNAVSHLLGKRPAIYMNRMRSQMQLHAAA